MKIQRYIILSVLWMFAWASYGQDITNTDLERKLDSLAQDIPGLNEKVDFTLVNGPLYELLRAVAETHDLNVSLNNLPQINITNNFTNVTVKDLIVFLCTEYNLKIRFTNNIFTFYQEIKESPVEPLVNFNATDRKLSINVQNQPLSVLAREITSKTPFNVIANQQVSSQPVNGFIRELPFEQALINFGEINNLKLETKEDGVFLYESMVPVQEPEARNYRNNNQRLDRGASGFDLSTYQVGGEYYISLNCSRTPTGDLIRTVSDRLSINYILLTEPQGFMDCRMDSVRFIDFLNIALETAKLSYSISPSDVYLIGDNQGGSLSQSRVYSFKNRSVEGVEEVIPASLAQHAQVKLFNDLNALIVTGSDRATERMVDFLKQIDQAVPNVLIEVIVAEVTKGSSVRTGVKAFLSDSVPNTSGQIFGGVDVTVSSQSFNRFLNNLDSRGILNLGRVTPNFYATIQAMEENNNLNIRSTPKLSTLNGHEATLTIGQSVYYLVETQNVTGGVNPIVTVTPRYEKVEANLDLKINPFVSDLEDVTLAIEAEFSDFIPPNVEGAPPGNATRKFISKIRVKNEEMVVMGGLEEASKSETGSGVPFLSRIPVLKWLFSSKTEERRDSKLLIFIKPTIVY